MENARKSIQRKLIVFDVGHFLPHSFCQFAYASSNTESEVLFAFPPWWQLVTVRCSTSITARAVQTASRGSLPFSKRRSKKAARMNSEQICRSKERAVKHITFCRPEFAP
jgi:hypothetical protein